MMLLLDAGLDAAEGAAAAAETGSAVHGVRQFTMPWSMVDRRPSVNHRCLSPLK